MLRLSSFSACCHKTTCENECRLASFNCAKEMCLSLSPLHTSFHHTQPPPDSYHSYSFSRVFIPIPHSHTGETSHGGILHYLNPPQHQASIFLTHPHPPIPASTSYTNTFPTYKHNVIIHPHHHLLLSTIILLYLSRRQSTLLLLRTTILQSFVFSCTSPRCL